MKSSIYRLLNHS